MQHLLFVFIILVSFSAGSLAQTSETFDIATFQPPTGWKKVNKDGALIFNISNQQKGTYAMVVLYGSGESSGNAKNDFEGDWQQFIVGQFGLKNKPQIEPTRNTEGWEVITGGAAFQNEQGTSVVALNTFSGFGKTFSLAAIFNSQDYVSTIEALVASIKLRKPATSSRPAPVTDNGTASILGTWGMGTSGSVRSDDYKNPYSVNNYGYSKAQYTFNSDGTYSFVSKTFRMTFDKILLVKESGTFQISGNNLTINPQKSLIQAWSKRDGVDKWGRLLTKQNRPLEKVTYQFTKHYFSGIQLWNLVLQANKATERDGPFSSNTTFPNAWYYAPISSNNPVIELPN
jgi:uncharacterized protein DUF5004